MAKNTDQLRDLDLAGLVAELRATKQEALNLRFRHATGQLDKTSELRKARRRIARLNTLIRQREIAAAGAGEKVITMSEATTEERNARKVREGVVVSNKMDKTAVIAVVERVRHPKYAKFVLRTKKLYAHDETNDVQVGDRVRVMETRPLSKNKRWRVVEVVERAK